MRSTGTLWGMPRQTDPATVIRSQVVLEEHDVSRDGSFAVVVRRFVSGDRYRSHLWLMPLQGGGRPVQLTSGRVRDAWPRIAPDGSAVAFRRTAAASRLHDTGEGSGDPDAQTARIRVLPLIDGKPGKPWSVRTTSRRSVGELAWSPDGTELAFTLDADPARFLVGPEPRRGESPLARRITRIDWRWDEAGHVDRWQHLFVTEASAGTRPRQLTSGDWGVSGIDWAPDGRSIAFVADLRPDADLLPRTSIWAITADAHDAQPREILKLGGPANSPAFSPDGRWLAAVGFVPDDPLDDISPEVVVGPADGSQPPWPLAPELDRPIGKWVDSDLHGWTANSRTSPVWLDDRTILAVVSDRGMAPPFRYEIDPATGRPVGEPKPIVDGSISAHSLVVAPDARGDGRVTMLACVGDRPMELVTVAARARSARVRTRMGSRWAAGLRWPEMRRISVPGAGGEIDTWIASPTGAVDGALPTVVDVHGGPLGAWTDAPHIEVVLLCAAGYRVLLPNIRGSTSYGRDWIRPQLGDWGGVDAADVHAAIDHTVELGLADPERLGVFGLSYGGFMVNWLVGTTDRFQAAVSENGVTNQISGWAGSDSGVEYNRMSLLGTPLDPAGVEKLWRQSPLRNVANIRTPLLMLQAEEDRRCPAADNEQLFVALRVLGRTVEYVLYPEESHVYMAAGRPDRRIDRMERVIAWFDRYIKA